MKQEKLVGYPLRLPKPLKMKLARQAKAERRSLNQFLILKLEEISGDQQKDQQAMAAA